MWWRQRTKTPEPPKRFMEYPRKFIILRFLIEGETKNYWFGRETYGGTGSVGINTLGGFGYDRVVKKMIDSKEVEFYRVRHRDMSRAFGGFPYFMMSRIRVTDKGRKEFERLKRRYVKITKQG
jgi:hypothetical protein